MKKPWRRRVWLLFDIAVIALVFFLAHLALNSSWAQGYYFALLEKGMGWQISAEEIEINPFLGKITIENANILSRSKRQLFAIGALRLRISPFSLVRGKIVFKTFLIRDVYLAFEKNPDPEASRAEFSIPYIRMITDKITESFFLQNVIVDRGHLDSLRILVHKRAGGTMDLQLKSFAFSLKQSLWRKKHFQFTAENFTIDGTVVGDTIALNSEIASQKVDLKPLLLKRPEGNYRLQLSATIEREAIPALVTLEADLPHILAEQARARLSLQLLPPKLQLDEGQFDFGVLSLTAKGFWNLVDQTHNFAVAAHEEFELATLAKILQPLAFPELTGQAKLAAELKGQFPRVRAEGKLTSQGSHYEDFFVPEAEVNAKLDWPHLSWEADLGSQATTTGEVRLPSAGRTLQLQDLAVRLEQLDLTTFVPGGGLAGSLSGELALKRGPHGLAGDMNFQLLSGRFQKTELERVTTRLSLAASELTVKSFELHAPALPVINFTAPLGLQFKGEVIGITGMPLPGLEVKANYLIKEKLFKIENLSYRANNQVLKVSGTYATDGTLQLAVVGDLGTEVLEQYRALFKKSEGGSLNINLHVTGSSENPSLAGFIDFRRASIALRGLTEHLRDLHGRVVFTPGRVRFEKLQGQQGDGNFRLEGYLDWNQFKPESFQLHFKGDALSFRIRKMLQMEFDADVTLSGTMPSPLVAGTIDILSGRYYKNFQITEVVFRESATPAGGETALTEFLKEWRWNVHLRNNGELRIANNVADVYLLGDLTLRGSTVQPIVDGVVKTGIGELHYLGHDMQITEGTLEFRDLLRARPYLDLEAQEEIAGSESRGLLSYYTVIVRLQGPLDNLQTELSSAPPLDQADVVSLLAFGMTQDELRARGRSRSHFATNVLASSLSSGLGANFGESVGLDVLRLESADGAAQAISGVAVGKNLSDRLSIEFFTDITPETAQRRVRSKYFLTDNIFLEGANTFENQRSKFEINLSLRFEVP